MKKQKIIIGILSLFLGFGAVAQDNDEVDDMYFFESDAKKAKKAELASRSISDDQPSELSKFANPDFAGGEELEEAYTPTYNYYDNDYSTYSNGFQSDIASRNGWYQRNFYGQTSFYAGAPFYGGNLGTTFYCPPGSFNRFNSFNSTFGWGGLNRWDCPPGSFANFSFGQRYYNSARWNTNFRYFNSFNNWSYNNVYCPPSAYGNTVSSPATVARNTVRAVRSNRSTRGSYNAIRSNSPRTYATRTVNQATRRSATRSGRSIGTRTSRYGSSSSYSSGRSSGYTRTRSSYGSSSGRSSSSRPSFSRSSSSSSRSRSSSFSSGSRSSSSSRSSATRSSSGSRSSSSSGSRRR